MCDYEQICLLVLGLLPSMYISSVGALTCHSNTYLNTNIDLGYIVYISLNDKKRMPKSSV